MEPTLVFDESLDSFFFRWLLAEKEAPVKFERADFLWNFAPVPYYREQDVVIHDHHALLQFLQERFPHQTLLPADPLVRAQVRQVCEFFREEATNMIPDIIAVLNQKTAYLMGDEFSIVDLYAGSWLRDATAVVPTIVEQYKLRLQGRPAYKKADAA